MLPYLIDLRIARTENYSYFLDFKNTYLNMSN